MIKAIKHWWATIGAILDPAPISPRLIPPIASPAMIRALVSYDSGDGTTRQGTVLIDGWTRAVDLHGAARAALDLQHDIHPRKILAVSLRDEHRFSPDLARIQFELET